MEKDAFLLSIFRNKTSKFGWQIFPEFAVTQGQKSLASLNLLKNYFKCGNIFVNRRKDNHKENIYRYCVRSIKDLHEVIIPFFKTHKLHTAKSEDLKLFIEAIELIEDREHIAIDGLKKIAHITSRMNRKKSSSFLESSETIRQTSRRNASLKKI